MILEADSWPEEEPTKKLADEQLLEKYRDPDEIEDRRIERMIQRERWADKAERKRNNGNQFL